MDEWQSDLVLLEVASRERNEWIDGENERFGSGPGLVEFACECSGESCPSNISMTHLEYEGIRANGNHFAIARDHENPEIDAVLAEGERYSTVSKLGEGGRIASDADPRRTQEN